MLANPLRIKQIGYDLLAVFFVVILAPDPSSAATAPSAGPAHDEGRIKQY